MSRASNSSRATCLPARARPQTRRLPIRVARGLLHDNPFCAGLEPDPEHVGPEAGAGAIAMDGRGDAGFLAGRSSENNVCMRRRKRADVVMDRDSGEALARRARRQGLLRRSDGLEAADALQADGVAADAGELRADQNRVPASALPAQFASPRLGGRGWKPWSVFFHLRWKSLDCRSFGHDLFSPISRMLLRHVGGELLEGPVAAGADAGRDAVLDPGGDALEGAGLALGGRSGASLFSEILL
jgi:hypothetical protein